ncbi:hypothetical protein [Mediterraneibacter agrestimuris]|uniref:hypothetical protein n=1 Tax=Mediterraneibacter agrestimuris TaxID=2941333 RepID=UPI002041E1FF|nr:hypothetical protein [Mediterraneibacter agrestimuris]
MDMVDRKNQVLVDSKENGVYINGTLTQICSANIVSLKEICVNIDFIRIAVITMHMSDGKWYFFIEDKQAYKKLLDLIIDRRCFDEIALKANKKNEEFYFLRHVVLSAIKQKGAFQDNYIGDDISKERRIIEQIRL